MVTGQVTVGTGSALAMDVMMIDWMGAGVVTGQVTVGTGSALAIEVMMTDSVGAGVVTGHGVTPG